MQFSISLRVEHLLPYVRSMLRKLCQAQVGPGSALTSPGELERTQLPRGEEDREAQAVSSAAPAVPRGQSACPIPVI